MAGETVASGHGTWSGPGSAIHVSGRALQTRLRRRAADELHRARPRDGAGDGTGSTATRAGYLAAVGGAIDFVTLKPLAPIRVRVYGNAAVARMHLAFEVHAGPTTLKHRGWATDLLERRQGRWQVVWSQSTATPNDEALLIRALQPKS